ncbi:MAG: hypothetical protein ACPLXL_01820 [Minisyncoccia bacterium]
MKEKILNLLNLREIIFFFLYFSLLTYFLLFFKGFSLLAFLMIIFLLVLWKALKGLSWINFLSLFLIAFELLFLVSWLNRVLVFLIGFLLFFLFFRKYLLPVENQKIWREYLLTTLLWLWIASSYSLYFFAGKPFIFSFIFYFFGLFIFLAFYFFFQYEDFSLFNEKTRSIFFSLLLINLEIFWLLSFLSLPLLVLSGLDLMFFYLFFHYKYFLKLFKNIF